VGYDSMKHDVLNKADRKYGQQYLHRARMFRDAAMRRGGSVWLRRTNFSVSEQIAGGPAHQPNSSASIKR